ncbi:threonylcarbamoyl-AMP synthase [Cohnella sp. CFH 77786]|uniref:L-threonylcarbamoyladenylate synthase n=1 Tax=Cohnella sp. CFH 77786 TaxID=2662265 RepID=UPI001C60C871|nr:L-threonylcarbamoyladenylate synthase [Cohnella sp. CFH 77786]MBW5445955.1 threonylcarbamoyl-AMP synthase [Cohnella sp. CFH 77786]
MMTETKYWPAEDSSSGLKEAAAALAAGGVVAFPTETVYGLGADARNTSAVAKIFEAKGRPSDNPLIVHVASETEAESLAESMNEIERRLARAFWPGPFTLVLPVRPGAVSPLVTAGLDTVAVRMPSHAVARRLIELSGCPLAAPSANRSGRPSPTEARHVTEDLAGRIDGIVDGGPTGVGLESTVVRVVDGVIHILRPGGVTREQLQAAAGPDAPVESGEREADASATAGPRSPGVKYTHYAPRGEMLLVTGDDPEGVVAAVRQEAADARREGRRVGILAAAEHAGRYEGAADEIVVCGSRRAPETAAQRLYAALRECDGLGLDFIVAEGYPEEGIGSALMNRMRKAAGGRERVVGKQGVS